MRAQTRASSSLALQPLRLPDWAPRSVSADLHVHMNYGGHYRNTEENLIEQARAEDLDVDLQPDRQQGAAHSGHRALRPGRDAAIRAASLIFRNQEYHTSYWGHLGLLHLQRST